MGARDPAEAAAILIGRGHDPEDVRRRLRIPPGEWAELRARCDDLDAALRGWEARLAWEAEVTLAREARVRPQAALAYARFVEQKRLNDARRRALDAKLGRGAEDAASRADALFRQMVEGLPKGEFELLGRVEEKARSGEPFDPEEQAMAAWVFLREREIYEEAKGEGGRPS